MDGLSIAIIILLIIGLGVLGYFYAIKTTPCTPCPPPCTERIGIAYKSNPTVKPVMDVMNIMIQTELVPKFLCANKDKLPESNLRFTSTTSCSTMFADLKKDSPGVPDETFAKFKTEMTPILCKGGLVNIDAIKKLPGDIIKAVC